MVFYTGQILWRAAYTIQVRADYQGESVMATIRQSNVLVKKSKMSSKRKVCISSLLRELVRLSLQPGLAVEWQFRHTCATANADDNFRRLLNWWTVNSGRAMRYVQRYLGTAIVIGLFTGNTCAQDQSIGRPILGFTVDQTGASISPILGVVGASILDQNLDLGFEIRNAVISPEHNYALAERSEDAKTVLFKVLENVPAVVELSELHTDQA